MAIRFEKQDDGTYKRTGDLPEGTENVWIYRDGRRSLYPFQLQLALKIVEQLTGTGSLPWVKSYVLQPAYSDIDSGFVHVTPEMIEGLVAFSTEFLWEEVQEPRPSFDVNAALAILVSVESERML